jgi:hypothetical protein
MGSGPNRPQTRYILPSGVYVIEYEDGKSSSIKIGVLDGDLTVTEESAWTDGSRVLLDLEFRNDNPKRPTRRGRDVLIERPA